MNETEPVVSLTSTACHTCVFADFDERNIQIGCTAGRLDHFNRAGTPLVQLEHEGKTGNIINGKICVYHRTEEFAEEKYTDIDRKLLPAHIKEKELMIPYHAILFFREGNMLEVRNRLKELQDQSVPPKIVTLIDRTHTERIFTGELIKEFRTFSFPYWEIQTVQTTDQSDMSTVDIAYDTTKKNQYMFYIIFECNTHIPSSMSSDIHRSLHDDMLSFTVLLPNGRGVGKCVLKAAHAKYSGNSFGIPLEEKIKHYGDSIHLIRKIEDICPSLQMS